MEKDFHIHKKIKIVKIKRLESGNYNYKKLNEYKSEYNHTQNILQIIKHPKSLITKEEKKYITNWLLRNEQNFDIFSFLSPKEKLTIYEYSNRKEMVKKYKNEIVINSLNNSNDLLAIDNEKAKKWMILGINQINEEDIIFKYNNLENENILLFEEMTSFKYSDLLLEKNININDIINYSKETKTIFENNDDLKILLDELLKE